jgi:hypothetical protein
VTAPEPTSAGRRGPELRNAWKRRSSPLGEAKPGPRGSIEAHLSREVSSRAEEHIAAPELSSRGGRA